MPVHTPGIIEPYTYCVSTKLLSSCGVGAYLYFFFFKYIIFSLVIALGMYSIPSIVISKFYTNDLISYCANHNATISFCSRYQSSQTFNQSDWLYQMSYESLNKTLWVLKNTTKNSTNANYDFYVPDYNFISFMTNMVLLSVNSLFLILLKNMIEEADFSNVTPADYALMITNLPEFSTLLELQEDYLTMV